MDDLLKSQKVSRALRQLRDEYISEGRPNMADNLTNIRVMIEASPELGARLYDILKENK